jgi:DNA repair photolyase
MNYISGNKHRLFINTSLGCNSSCSYCYLPQLNLSIGEKVLNKKCAEEILEILSVNDLFNEGKNGTLISIGCYSECWDKSNVEETKKLIKFFIGTGNQIQLATKCYIDYQDISLITRKIEWKGQLVVFVSCSTISEWSVYEHGTSPPEKRFLSLNVNQYLDIPSCLYIKPVINEVTLRDYEQFRNIMETYNVPAVVGSRFSDVQNSAVAPVGEEKLFYMYKTDETKMIENLSKVGKVYEYSTELMKEWRENARP